MAVWCFGSINVDHFYDLSHLPAPGETLAARGYRVELGGKGANQSVAAARAGAVVRHVGAVGADGDKVLSQMVSAGVDCGAVQRLDGATGHAVILVERGVRTVSSCTPVPTATWCWVQHWRRLRGSSWMIFC